MWGPNARDVLERVADGDLSEAGFPFMQARHIRIGGAAAFAQRVTYVGELGWELYLEPGWAVQVWDRLMSAGLKFGIVAGGYRALDSLRMEKGYRYYGTDLTLLDNPFEAGLGFCVQLDKGEFNGRQALLAARESGLKRRLRTLAVGGEDYLPIYGGEAVHGEEGVIGRLRSCAYGFTARQNLAYSYLPVGMVPGGHVKVEVFGELVPATVMTDAVVPKRAAEQQTR
jgi:4-methylaminobutanoate oxidase (formaldehyde-forming)